MLSTHDLRAQPSRSAHIVENRGHVDNLVHQQNIQGDVHFHRESTDIRNLLPVATEAAFDSAQKTHLDDCLEDTRTDLLEEITAWAAKSDENGIFWLNGMAGTGKSTVARTIARKFHAQKKLAASFFFSRGGGDAGNSSRFFPTIAYQLASVSPPFHAQLLEALKENRDSATKTLRDQWENLILSPLTRAYAKVINPPSLLLVVDALDECDQQMDTRFIVELFRSATDVLQMLRIRIFMTSRPGTVASQSLTSCAQLLYYDLSFQDRFRDMIDHDIRLFLNDRFRRIRENAWDVAPDWPGIEAIEALVHQTNGLFIYAATICRFIASNQEDWPLNDLLEEVLSSSNTNNESRTTIDRSSVPPTGELDELYRQVLVHTVEKLHCKDKDRISRDIVEILGYISLLYEPLSLASLSSLLDIPQAMLSRRLGRLSTILNLPDDDALPIQLLHPSFRDFIRNRDRCGDLFWIGPGEGHYTLWKASLKRLGAPEKGLKRDMLSLEDPGALVEEMDPSVLAHAIGQDLRYASRNWVQHLQHAEINSQTEMEVAAFIHEHLLHWIEVLGWIGSISQATHSVILLHDLASAYKDSDLHCFMYDAKRLLLSSRRVLEIAPLQIYSSVLMFAPGRSQVRNHFQASIPSPIKRLSHPQSEWSHLLRTFELPNDARLYISIIQMSEDGHIFVLIGSFEFARLLVWALATGDLLRDFTFKLKRSVHCMACSPNGQYLAVAAKTVEVRETASGAVLWSSGVTSNDGYEYGQELKFSPDNKFVMFLGTRNKNRLWESKTGKLIWISDPAEWKTSPAFEFSPNGEVFAMQSSSNDNISIWKIEAEASSIELKSTSLATDYKFGPDGSVIASVSSDGTISIWCAQSGCLLRKSTPWDRSKVDWSMWEHYEASWFICFSPNGKFVFAYGILPGQTRVWDPEMGNDLKFDGPRFWGTEHAVWSPDSRMIAIRIAGEEVLVYDSHTGEIWNRVPVNWDWHYVSFSSDSKLLVTTMEEGRIGLWDMTRSGSEMGITGFKYTEPTIRLGFGASTIISSGPDHKVRIWKQVKTALEATTLDFEITHGSEEFHSQLSQDGRFTMLHKPGGDMEFWENIPAPRRIARFKAAAQSFHRLLASSSLGDFLTKDPNMNKIYLWRFKLGKPREMLLQGRVEGAKFSPDGRSIALLLLSTSENFLRILDSELWEVKHYLRSGFKNSYIPDFRFSPDGNTVALAYREDILLWSVSTGALLQKFSNGYDGIFYGIAFSPNNRYLNAVVKVQRDGLLEVGSYVMMWNCTTGSFDGVHKAHLSECISPGRRYLQPMLASAIIRGGWVMDGERRIIWVPPEWRSVNDRSGIGFRNNVLAWARKNGDVVAIEFEDTVE